MTEIPDIVDSPTLPSQALSSDLAALSLDPTKEATPKEEAIPDMDDIPDMDEAEGLEEDDDDAAVKIVHPSE